MNYLFILLADFLSILVNIIAFPSASENGFVEAVYTIDEKLVSGDSKSETHSEHQFIGIYEDVD